MLVLYRNIPAELTRLSRRGIWRYEERNKKITRPPYVPARKKSATHLSISLPRRGIYEEARNAFENGGFDGTVFVPGQELSGIDFNHATDDRDLTAFYCHTVKRDEIFITVPLYLQK